MCEFAKQRRIEPQNNPDSEQQKNCKHAFQHKQQGRAPLRTSRKDSLRTLIILINIFFSMLTRLLQSSFSTGCELSFKPGERFVHQFEG